MRRSRVGQSSPRAINRSLTELAAFQMAIDNVQCRHVILGGSADNGYARLLGPHRGSAKVALIEGPPFAKELVELASHFGAFDCQDVFSKTKLTVAQPLGTITPPRSPPPVTVRTVNFAAVASNPAA